MMHSTEFHLAIIPDGNRRWARAHGIAGYKKLYDRGFAGLLGITEAAFESGVSHLSMWGSSHANLADRSSQFRRGIDKAFRENIQKFADHPAVEKYDVRIDVIGEWRDSLSPETIDAFQTAINRTRHRTGRCLTLLIDYSGSRERAAAFLEASRAHARPQTIEQAAAELHAYSWTRDLPPLDLIIRTGAWQDPHNSAGFMSLLADEAQLAFPEMLWPDFTPEILTEIVSDYKMRERRHGK